MKLTIRKKLILISSTLLILPIIILGSISYLNAKSQLDDKGEIILKNGVRQAMQLIESKKIEVKRGKISLDKAQEEVRVILLGEKDADGKRPISKNIDLGENGYFIAYTGEGIEAMHPSLEGVDVWAVEDKGGNGQKFVQDQIAVAKAGGGFVSYAWTLPASEKIGTKISYQEYDADWNWVVSASAYHMDFNQSANAILYIIFTVLGVSVLLGAVVIYFFSNHIANPIRSISEALFRMSESDLTAQEISVKNKDEIGILADAYNKLQVNLNHLVRSMQGSSGTVTSLSSSLVDITDQTSHAINEVAKTIQEVAGAVQDEAHMTESAVQKVHEISASIESVTEGTLKLENLAKSTSSTSNEGLTAVKDLVSATKKSNASTDKISEVILKVSESTGKIHIFTETITRISGQTNLLALNASIEAARAGEAGRGFAVVADEIRKLAEESAGAVLQIQEMIKEIDGHSRVSIDTMKELKEMSLIQTQSVDTTLMRFEAISEGVKKLHSVINEIQTEAENMTEMKDAVVDAMTNISASTEETSASTEEVSASTEEQLAGMTEINNQSEKLNVLANELENLIREFKIA